MVNHPNRSRPLREQNAELLAALTELLEWNALMGGFDASCWERARAALAKAEGRS